MSEWRVTILDPAEPDDRRALERLLASGVAPLDTLAQQLADLADARSAGRRLDDRARARVVEEITAGEALSRYGRWVYFPWHREVVRLLPPDAFHELRTDRNRHRITAADQLRLRGRRIAVAGLSVGLASAVTLATEGIGGAFHLADFDTLALSNLNRIQVAVRELGASKAEIAARRLLDIDPYLDIAIFPEGVREDTIDPFLGLAGGHAVDLLVEECDDLEMKLRLRERARDGGIPVIMETSDRGLLDIERFDLEPDRPILHGVVAGLRAADLRGLGPAQKLVPLARIVDVDRVSAPLAASVVEINRTTASWPQLASAVCLGGAIVTDTARRILLGQIDWSGRHYVDLEKLVSLGARAPIEAPRDDTPAAAPVASPPRPARGAGGPSLEETRWLVAQAVKAPSGGNSQPWLFELSGDEMRCALDPARCLDLLAGGGLAPAIALGAAVENLVLSAPLLGLAAEVEPLEPPSLDAPLARVRLRRRDAPVSPLAAAIDARACRRSVSDGSPLTAGERSALLALPAEDGVQIELHDDRARLEALGRVAGAWDRLRVLSTTLHPEMVRELRFSRADAEATRDGIELASLELPPRLELGLRVVARPDAAACLRAIDGGDALRDGAALAYAQASALARFLVRRPTRGSFFDLGRTLQRFWLTAVSLGIGARPYGAYLFAVAGLEGGGAGLDAFDRDELAALARAHRAALPAPDGWADGFLLLINRAPPPAVRSLRRRLDDVLR